MKAVIIYWTGSGNTGKMAELIAEGLKSKEAMVQNFLVSAANLDMVADADLVLLGSPSMGMEVVEEFEMEPFVASLEGKIQGKKMALFGSYGWGDGQWIRDWEERMKGYGAKIELESLGIQGEPTGSDAENCIAFGAALAN
jgi:flavodoxin I